MTEEEKKSLVQDVLSSIKASSQSVDELETVGSLDGINSLPAQRGDKLVKAPISLLAKPATEAAGAADKAAKAANGAAAAANSSAESATAAAGAARTAASNADSAASSANSAVAEMADYESRVELAMNGASARFDGFVEGVNIALVSFTKIDGVYYDTLNKRFCGRQGNKYCSNWAVDGNTYSAEMFLDESRTAVRKDKVFMCGASLYVWSEEEDNLVEISGSGGGNTYNVTEEIPLESGYYTLETAIAAVEEKKRGKGRCITFETAQGKWETKQFMGTSLSSWENAESWGDFGGGGKVKSVTLNGERCEPNEAGDISLRLDVPEVDASLDEASTNAIQNGVVATKLKELEAHTLGSIEVVPDGDDTIGR